MIKFLFKNILILSALVFFGADKANAEVLDNGYLITQTVISNVFSNNNTTSIAI